MVPSLLFCQFGGALLPGRFWLGGCSFVEERGRRESARSRVKDFVRFKCQEPGPPNGFAGQFTGEGGDKVSEVWF